jgi:hypothetical protein
MAFAVGWGCFGMRFGWKARGGPGAGAVPADRRQEVAVLQGGVPGLQVLRGAHASLPFS